MAVWVDKEKCTGCGSCVEVCPTGALAVQDIAVVNEDECLECGACVDECPNGALKLP
ncbi:MAG: 4Fe-4S binding protein [Moorellaceae bacterium]